MQIMAGSGRILFLARKKVMTMGREGTGGGCIRNYIGNCTSGVFQERLIASSIALVEGTMRLRRRLCTFYVFFKDKIKNCLSSS